MLVVSLNITFPSVSLNCVVFIWLPSSMSLLILFCGLLLLQSIYIYIRNSGGKLPTPPGPICLPVVGNALQLPKEHAWLAFSKWSRVYGQCPLRTLNNIATDSEGRMDHRACHVSLDLRRSYDCAELPPSDIRSSGEEECHVL